MGALFWVLQRLPENQLKNKERKNLTMLCISCASRENCTNNFSSQCCCTFFSQSDSESNRELGVRVRGQRSLRLAGSPRLVRLHIVLDNPPSPNPRCTPVTVFWWPGQRISLGWHPPTEMEIGQVYQQVVACWGIPWINSFCVVDHR